MMWTTSVPDLEPPEMVNGETVRRVSSYEDADVPELVFIEGAFWLRQSSYTPGQQYSYARHRYHYVRLDSVGFNFPD